MFGRISPEIAVTHTSLCGQSQAEKLALQLSLPLVKIDDPGFPIQIVVTEDRLELRAQTRPSTKPLYVDFLHGKSAFRNCYRRGSELIARAVGIKKYPGSLNIIDATAGLGGDAYVLANLGCKVTMLERSEIVAALLEDGLVRLFRDQGHDCLQFKLINTDSKKYLSSLSAEERLDVVYLDPMYPHLKKSAAQKIAMRLLREIVGADEDAVNLLPVALQVAEKRVVVKRPRLAPHIKGYKPDLVFAGNSSRFDVYLIHK